MNYGQLQQEVLAHGFQVSMQPRIKTWLNEGYQTLLRKTRLAQFSAKEDIAITAGQSTIATPTPAMTTGGVGLDSIMGITDLLTQMPLSRILATSVDASPPNQGGDPTAYFLDALGITLVPTPPSARSIRLRYLVMPIPMTADTDIPTLPSYYHDAIVAYAVSRGYRAEDDPQQATNFMGDFDRRVSEAIVAMRAENIDGPIQVPGTWSGARSSPWGS